MKPSSRVAVLSCLLLSSAGVFCQGVGDRGLLMGFNTSSFWGSESTLKHSAYMPGMSIGFFQEFHLNSHLILGPEITFTTKGSRVQTVGDLYLHQVLTYMEIPLLANYVINPKGGSRVFLFTGPGFDMLLLAFNEVGFPEDIARFDVGAILGIGIRWNKMRIRFHMNQGLLDLDQSNMETNVKNRTFSFAIGLSF